MLIFSNEYDCHTCWLGNEEVPNRIVTLYPELQKKHLKELSSNKRNNFAFLLCSQQKIKPTLNGCALSKPTEQEDRCKCKAASKSNIYGLRKHHPPSDEHIIYMVCSVCGYTCWANKTG